MQVQERVPQLIVQGGPEKGREIPLAQELLTIGRLESSDIPVSDRLASRRHAEIERKHGQCILRDRGSRNGTFVNGQRISEPHILRDGDEIQIGLEFKALYVDPEATGALGTEVVAVSKGLWIDRDSREVWVGGKELTPPVSKAQFSLLTLLYEKPGRVYSRDDIVAAVWPENASEGVSDETIDALVGRLRRRIAAVDPSHRYVITVRGHGFKLVQPWDR
jgi:pSer/pThr/pTyr-binding forkhead associated (FHA) protein